jgi:hypothetical protein
MLTDYVDLPENDYDATMEALVDRPLAVNVDASAWGGYSSGVFDNAHCGTDGKKAPGRGTGEWGRALSTRHLAVNHVVQLVGYGTDSTGTDYWIIRNRCVGDTASEVCESGWR